MKIQNKSQKKIGRPRIIPKSSKTLKYFYLIKVRFKKQEVLKLGISNNIYRRVREYNNEDKSGYLIEILHVYKCSNPKRLEAVLKYYLPQFGKTIFKNEYWDLKYYDLVKESLFKLAKLFNYKLEEFDFEELRTELLKK